MPIDPNIYALQSRPVPFNNPFERLGEIRDQQQRHQLNAQAIRSNQALEESRRQDIAKQQREEEREARVRALFSQPTPPTAEQIISEAGPERGSAILTGLSALKKATQGDYTSTQKVLRDVLLGMNAIPEDVRAAQYPKVRGGLIQSGVIREEDAPADYDPQWFAQTVNFGKEPKEPKYQQVKTRDANGVETTQFAEEKPGQTFTSQPDAPKSLEAMIAAAVAKNDQPELKRLIRVKQQEAAATRAPNEGPKPGYQWITRQGPDGKPHDVYTNRVEPGDRPKNTREQVSDTEDLVKAVIKSPGLWDQLTPSDKGRIAGGLEAAGFGDLGKPLPSAAVTKISDAKTAVDALKDLKVVLKENEQYVGPIAGYQALNPYSDARKAQGKIEFVRQKVGKALEGGVLRKEDETKYKKMLSELTDTPSTALSKADYMIEQLQNDLDNYINEQRQAGRRVSTTTSGRTEKPTTGGDEVIEFTRDPATGKLKRKR